MMTTKKKINNLIQKGGIGTLKRQDAFKKNKKSHTKKNNSALYDHKKTHNHNTEKNNSALYDHKKTHNPNNEKKFDSLYNAYLINHAEKPNSSNPYTQQLFEYYISSRVNSDDHITSLRRAHKKINNDAAKKKTYNNTVYATLKLPKKTSKTQILQNQVSATPKTQILQNPVYAKLNFNTTEHQLNKIMPNLKKMINDTKKLGNQNFNVRKQRTNTLLKQKNTIEYASEILIIRELFDKNPYEFVKIYSQNTEYPNISNIFDTKRYEIYKLLMQKYKMLMQKKNNNNENYEEPLPPIPHKNELKQ